MPYFSHISGWCEQKQKSIYVVTASNIKFFHRINLLILNEFCHYIITLDFLGWLIIIFLIKKESLYRGGIN